MAATGVRDVFVPPELLDLEIICFSSNSVYRGYTPRRNPFKTHGRIFFLAADAPASKGFGKCMRHHCRSLEQFFKTCLHSLRLQSNPEPMDDPPRGAAKELTVWQFNPC